MPVRDLDRAIDGLARRQHGVFHRRQAVRLGFTRSMVRRRVDTGRWVRLAESEVFALPSHPGNWLRQCMAATLSVPGGAVCGASAAALLRFPGWKRGAIEVCTHRDTTHRSSLATVRTSATVGRQTVVDGIRVVSHADCLVQLAGQISPSRLANLLDDVRQERRTIVEELGERYADLARSRLPGIGGVRAALLRHGDGAERPATELERRLRALLATVPALPPVEWEHTPA